MDAGTGKKASTLKTEALRLSFLIGLDLSIKKGGVTCLPLLFISPT
jgi:hypothetical protein